MTAAFPLQWPDHIPRHRTRERSRFKASLATALKNVETSLKGFARDSGKPLQGLVISSNVTLGASTPADPGVEVWFTWDQLQVCIPVDRYATVEANLQAIHHILEARRTELRHGTLALVRATFMGFKALPPAGGESWWSVLGVAETAAADTIEAAYRHAAKKAHPDAGGSAAQFERIKKARDAGLKARGKLEPVG